MVCKQKLVLFALCLLEMGSLQGCGVTNGFGGGPIVRLTFGYSPNRISNAISVFQVDNTGYPNQSQTVGGLNQPEAIALSPNGAVLFAVNSGNSSLSSFQVDGATGALSHVMDLATGTTPFSVATFSNFVFTADRGSNQISGFTYDGGGNLTPNGTYPQGSSGFGSVAFSPSGSVLFGAAFGGSKLFAYPVGANGILGAPKSASTGNFPASIAIHPTSPFVYVANQGTQLLSAFSYAPDGTLTSIDSTGCGLGAGPTSVAMSPFGTFLFVANDTDNNVTICSIDSNGIVSSAGTQILPNVPSSVSVDPSGLFLYVTLIGGSNAILPFAIGQDGSLTRLQSVVSGGNNPTTFSLISILQPR